MGFSHSTGTPAAAASRTGSRWRWLGVATYSASGRRVRRSAPAVSKASTPSASARLRAVGSGSATPASTWPAAAMAGAMWSRATQP